jgi:hypothetical protein
MFNAASLLAPEADRTVKFGTVAWLLSEETPEGAKSEAYYR